MEKKYDLPHENNEKNIISEPAIKYNMQEEIKILPLTEEDLKDTISADEFWENTLQYVGELFNKK
ncbi:MAG: hypothetical protein LUH15_19150 [Tannerellaceae bacterium]|nr:hypothetical protein [Tannerellaceae bacterium]